MGTPPDNWLTDEHPSLGRKPMLPGPESAYRGYYELEAIERHVAATTLAQHRDEVDLWYRLLTLHRTALDKEFRYDSREDEWMARSLCAQLIVLALAHSKAALDLLIVGYYSIAFAAIRHIIESWLYCQYVNVMPAEAAAFYAPAGGEDPTHQRKVKTVVAQLKKRARDKAEAEVFQQAYGSWEIMSSGSHPSGIGIIQTVASSGKHGVLGPTYSPSLARDGLHHGLGAVMVMVHEAADFMQLEPTWKNRLAEVESAFWKVRDRTNP